MKWKRYKTTACPLPLGDRRLVWDLYQLCGQPWIATVGDLWWHQLAQGQLLTVAAGYQGAYPVPETQPVWAQTGSQTQPPVDSIADCLGIVTSHVTLEQTFHCSLKVTVCAEEWSSTRHRCHVYVYTGYRMNEILHDPIISTISCVIVMRLHHSIHCNTIRLLITHPHSDNDTKTCYNRRSHQSQEYQWSCPLLYLLLETNRSLTRPVYETWRVS